MTYESVREAGKKNISDIVETKPKDIFTLSFTSGTTGIPKGVMLNHYGLSSTINAMMHTTLKLSKNDVHLSYLPLSHIFERLVMYSLLYNGAKISFYGGNVLKLTEDWQLVKPTLIPIVPRLINKIYAKI